MGWAAVGQAAVLEERSCVVRCAEGLHFEEGSPRGEFQHHRVSEGAGRLGGVASLMSKSGSAGEGCSDVSENGVFSDVIMTSSFAGDGIGIDPTGVLGEASYMVFGDGVRVGRFCGLARGPRGTDVA